MTFKKRVYRGTTIILKWESFFLRQDTGRNAPMNH